MASQNRLINGPVGELEVQIKRFSKVLYRPDVKGGVLFTDRTQYEEAIKSEEWVTSPAKLPQAKVPEEKHEGCPYWINGDCTMTEDEPEEMEEEKKLTLDELAKSLRTPETPIDPAKITRQLGIRNLAELRATGMPLGLDFPEGTTRKQMIDAIRKRQAELKREAQQ